MATKTITIMEDAYELLKRRKGPDESFTEVIRKMDAGKGRLSDYAGAWKDMTDEEEKAMWKHIRSIKESWGNDMPRF